MKKISLGIYLSLLLLFIVFSCRDDYNFDAASKPLRFSKDTVMLDTVFSSVRSETYVLKVYNQQNEDVNIPQIYLEEGSNSQFKINVDGIPGGTSNGNNFHNIPIRAKDSIYIFIEIAPKSIAASEALADEDLIFNTVGNTQKVKLLSLVEDADFYYSSNGVKEISTDLVWDKTKSKVIYGDLKFINGAKLTIEEGTRVYFHKDASLIMDDNSTLAINGALNNEVIIRGDRHSARYDSLAGNWNQILLKPNATATVNYAIIRGGDNAFYLEKNAQLSISNTQIHNFLYSGIYSIGGNVSGENLAINNCGSSDLFVEYGGNYDFTQCSFANYWNLTAGNAYSVYLSNTKTEEKVYNGLNAIFKNCIFWGKSYNSIYLDKNSNAPFVYTFDTNLIKNSSNRIDIENDSNFINTILNKNPLFYKTGSSNTLLSLNANSPAIASANLSFALTVPQDILGINRTINPSLGAYQK